MRLQDDCVIEGTVHGPFDNGGILSLPVGVPCRVLASRDHRDRDASIEVVLVVCEIEHNVEIVPRQHTRRARADLSRIQRLDDLVVRVPMQFRSVLPF